MKYFNRKGQGTTEYIVILALIVGFLSIVFWKKIQPILTGKVNQMATNIQAQ